MYKNGKIKNDTFFCVGNVDNFYTWYACTTVQYGYSYTTYKIVLTYIICFLSLWTIIWRSQDPPTLMGGGKMADMMGSEDDMFTTALPPHPRHNWSVHTLALSVSGQSAAISASLSIIVTLAGLLR